MTIFGWDASDFDHDRGMRATHIQRAAGQGVRFFTHKITEGTHVTHRHAGDKLKAARDAGIPFLGAYIVVRSGPSIRAQVDHAIAQTDRQAPWWRTFPGWFWQVDLEKWSYDQVPVTRGPAMCTELERRSRHRAVLYAPRWAYGDSIPGSDPLWASNYGTNGTGDFRQLYPGDSSSRWVSYSGRRPAILQYGSRATIGGQRTCDANAYRGTEAEFARLINAPEGDDDMQLNDPVSIPKWMVDKWPDEGLKDGTISVNTALGSGYGHARSGKDETYRQTPILKAILAAVAGEDVADAAARASRDAVRAEFATLGPALAGQLADVPAERVEAALRNVLGSLDEGGA